MVRPCALSLQAAPFRSSMINKQEKLPPPGSFLEGYDIRNPGDRCQRYGGFQPRPTIIVFFDPSVCAKWPFCMTSKKTPLEFVATRGVYVIV